MVIYKITNLIDGNVYIGQTRKNAEERFKEHCRDAVSGRLDTALAKAIRKYGPDNFSVDEIEAVESEDKMGEREAYWIERYDSVRCGYNMTAGGDGGNTYSNKTPEEMRIIREKIRISKLGKKNPHHKKVKCLNILTGEELHFDTVRECMEHFGEKHNSFIIRRCKRKVLFLYKCKWLFAYETDDYPKVYRRYKRTSRSRRVFVTDLKTRVNGLFPSYADAERYFELKPKALSGKASTHNSSHFVLRKRYDITIIE